jgi:hypothetical protein
MKPAQAAERTDAELRYNSHEHESFCVRVFQARRAATKVAPDTTAEEDTPDRPRPTTSSEYYLWFHDTLEIHDSVAILLVVVKKRLELLREPLSPIGGVHRGPV